MRAYLIRLLMTQACFLPFLRAALSHETVLERSGEQIHPQFTIPTNCTLTKTSLSCGGFPSLGARYVAHGFTPSATNARCSSWGHSLLSCSYTTGSDTTQPILPPRTTSLQRVLMGTCYAELKRALDDSVRLINEIVAFVCNTMVTENAVAYVTVSESDANAQKLVSKAVQVLSQPVNPQMRTMFLLCSGRCGAPGPRPRQVACNSS